ncbi:MAG: T9SS type A sorting domain-containing protein [Candidatus Eisenbacteria sp.]|nr:T9SS type A sorting domain-containing protein [Candidatus Eisenbacteria bacterium]
MRLPVVPACLLLGLLAAVLSGVGVVSASDDRASQDLLIRAGQLFDAPAPPAGSDAGAHRTLQSATPLLNEIKVHAPGLVPEALAGLADYLERPTLLTEQFDTPHFRIHYATVGEDRPAGWPNEEYLRAIAGACETVWSAYHETGGWPQPASDGAAGGDGRIDVYVRDLGWGVYGYALHEDLPGRRGKTGFIVLENDYAGCETLTLFEALQVSLAHEYFHLIEFGYGYDPEANWFMEQMATMMEGRVYPAIADRLRYVVQFADRPYRRLDLSDGSFEYGAWLWPEFLRQRWGEDLLRAIWETWGVGGRTMLAAIDEQLRARGTGLDETFLDWAVWNAFLGPDDDHAHYEQAGRIPAAVSRQGLVSSYPVERWHPAPWQQAERLGANYVELRPAGESADNRLTVHLEACATVGGAVLIAWRWDGEAPVIEPIVLAGGRGVFVLSEWDQYERACLVVANGSAATECCDFALDATTCYAVAGVEEEIVGGLGVRLASAPNPFDPYTTISFSLPEQTPVALRIFDAQGRVIDTLIDGTRSAGTHGIRWQGPALAPRGPGAGVYFCEIRTPLGRERLRLVRLQ